MIFHGLTKTEIENALQELRTNEAAREKDEQDRYLLEKASENLSAIENELAAELKRHHPTNNINVCSCGHKFFSGRIEPTDHEWAEVCDNHLSEVLARIVALLMGEGFPK